MPEKTTMSGLLLSDQEMLRDSLYAHASQPDSLSASASLLEEEAARLLLKYNASLSGDPLSQAVTECMMAAAREQFSLLGSIRLKTEEKKSKAPESKAIISLLLSVILLLSGLLFHIGSKLHDKLQIPEFFCIVFAVFFSYLSGRIWQKKPKKDILPDPDPEKLLRVLKRTAETIDRKEEEFSARRKEWEAAHQKEPLLLPEDSEFDQESLTLYTALLEAYASGNGEFAIKQLEKLPPYLNRRGITLEEYDGKNGDHFEVLPTKRNRMTLRPALLKGEKLLCPGKAADK